MNRRNFIQNTALTIGALTLTQKNLLALSFEDPWKITMLRGNVGIFEERGGTIAFLLSKEGLVAVDSQFPDQSKHLVDEMKKRGEALFKMLINTHHHGDHSSGNISFKGYVERVVAHANSRINQESTAKTNKNEEKQFYPDTVYTDSWSQEVGNEKIRLHYFGAGHTNGDSFVQFEKANIIHCGDLVFNRRHPYVDRVAGANMKNWMSVLGKAMATFNKDTQYVFGHAAGGYKVTGTIDDLKAFQDYLGNVLKFVEGEIRLGKTKEEILKATMIPGADDWKTPEGIQRPLGAAFDELTSK